MIHYQAMQHSPILLPTTHDFIIHVILQYPSNLYLNVYKTARKGMPKSDRHVKPNAIYKTYKKNLTLHIKLCKDKTSVKVITLHHFTPLEASHAE
jgi:hypothetical protein